MPSKSQSSGNLFTGIEIILFPWTLFPNKALSLPLSLSSAQVVRPDTRPQTASCPCPLLIAAASLGALGHFTVPLVLEIEQGGSDQQGPTKQPLRSQALI